MRLSLVVPSPRRDRGIDAILHVHRFTLAQARAFVKLGLDVDLFVDGPTNATDRIDGVSLHRVRSRSDRWVGPSLVVSALRTRPDVLHQYNLLALPSLTALALSPVRGFAEYNGGRPFARSLERRWMRQATARLLGVFFTGTEMAAPFIRAGALHPDTPIIAVPEIASMVSKVDRASARRSMGLGDAPTVLVVARAALEKDPLVALSAFELVRQKRPNAVLFWAALERGPLHGAVEARVVALAGRMFVGADVAPLYAAADVMIHTSLREVCGAAFVEALTAGVPVAASDIPAFRALAGRGARLCEIGDARGFAEAALALLDDPGARGRASARGEALSFDSIAAQKLEAYVTTSHRR